jgi:hypothetical protein
MRRPPAHLVPAAAVLALALLACEQHDAASAAPSTTENLAMGIPPSSSRPPAPVVPPVEHAGIRYTQDATDERRGDQRGGYLAADDIETGARLWRLQVYRVPDHRAAGVAMGGIYFRSMRLAANGTALEIENEVGGAYRVDLATRQVTKVGGPPDEAPPAAPVPPKPVPQ